MPYLTTVIGGRTSVDLETNLATFFAAHLDIQVFSVSFMARDQISTIGNEMLVGINYDDAGTTMTTPYTASLILGSSAGDLAASVATEVATDPTAFWAGPFLDSLGQRRRSDDFVALLITSDDAAAAANWQA